MLLEIYSSSTDEHFYKNRSYSNIVYTRSFVIEIEMTAQEFIEAITSFNDVDYKQENEHSIYFVDACSKAKGYLTTLLVLLNIATSHPKYKKDLALLVSDDFNDNYHNIYSGRSPFCITKDDAVPYNQRGI